LRLAAKQATQIGYSIDTSRAPAYPSHLWIIALFIALSEVTAGIAAIATDGPSRLIFAVFTVVFPLLVFFAFLWLLVHHPANLYGPWQYPKGGDVDAYAGALARQRRAAKLVFRHAATEAIASASAKELTDVRPNADPAEIEEELDRLIEKSSIIIDCSAFGKGDRVPIPVTDETTVADLLNAIYFELAPAIQPFTYGESWVLKDGAGDSLTDMGTRWAEERGQRSDLRLLNQVEIDAGSTFRVTPLAGWVSGGWRALGR
jgi:hypothetical protein